MTPVSPSFDRLVREQIAANRARTPTERFMALCDLLDAVHAMAPKDLAARERRQRANAVHEREREQSRERFRHFLATYRTDASTGI